MTKRREKESEPLLPLLTLEEVAAILGTTPQHVRQLYYYHELAYVKIGKKVRFKVADLERFIEDNREERLP